MQVKRIEEKPKVEAKVKSMPQPIQNTKKISLNNEVKIQDLNPPSNNKNLQDKNEIKVESKVESKIDENKSIKKPISSNKKEYFLQLASFKDYKDADNLRAKLILSGIDVDIYKAKLANGAVWYRVRSKKNTDYQEVDNLKNKLLAFRVKAIILKDIG